MNYSDPKAQAYKEHADAVYKEFMQQRFGITVCCFPKSIDEIELDKELCDWKLLTGRDLLSEVQMRRYTVKPIFLGGEVDDTYYTQGKTADNASFNYQYAYDAEQNIIEVNVGGSITRINVNPVINISRNNEYTHNQLVPAMEWVITHNFGFTPNVFPTDLNGAEIEAVIKTVDDNTIKVCFTEPVAGYAYLT